MGATLGDVYEDKEKRRSHCRRNGHPGDGHEARGHQVCEPGVSRASTMGRAGNGTD